MLQNYALLKCIDNKIKKNTEKAAYKEYLAKIGESSYVWKRLGLGGELSPLPSSLTPSPSLCSLPRSLLLLSARSLAPSLSSSRPPSVLKDLSWFLYVI